MTVYLLAHGSVDPRHAADVELIGKRLGATLDRDVRACYLDLCPPSLREVAELPGVVVPLLFSPGYHARVDVAEAVAQARVPLAVAAPPLLTAGADWGRDLLAETRLSNPGRAVVFVTAGTRDAEVLAMWGETAGALGIPVVHASGLGPRLADAPLAAGAEVVALPLLVARGSFSDQIGGHAAAAGMPVAEVAGTSEALIAELARVVRAA